MVRVAPLHLASEPGEPSDHLARLGVALMDADDLDEVARRLLSGLTALDGVRRAGLALTEGGGRRLRFVASDAATEAGDHSDGDGALDWCHIDAYDDVPLTAVVRTGESIIRPRERMDRRYASFVAHQPEEVLGIAAVPLPGTGSPLGGLILYLEVAWEASDQDLRVLGSVTQHTADAVRRVRAATAREPGHHLDAASAAAERAGSLDLPDDPESVSLARHLVRDLLAGCELPRDFSETAQLLVSELATNAVMHTSGGYEVRVTFDSGLLTAAVRDHGQTDTEVAADSGADPLDVHGRGLQLVEALSDRWGSQRDALGSTVWFVLDARTAASRAVG